MADTFSRRKALTWITCTVIAVLGLPAGAFAVVAGSNAFITDPGTGHRAHVNTSGQLLVNTGGSAVRVSNTVPVSGTVNVPNTGPTQPFVQSCTATKQPAGGRPTCAISIPTGKHLVITNATLECSSPTAPSGGIPGQFTVGYGGTFTNALVPMQAQGQDAAGYYDEVGALQGPLYLGAPTVIGGMCDNVTLVVTVNTTVFGYLY